MTDMELAEIVIREKAIKTLREAAESLKCGGCDIEVRCLNTTVAEAVVSGWHLQKIDDDCKREDDHKKQSCQYELDQETAVHMV